MFVVSASPSAAGYEILNATTREVVKVVPIKRPDHWRAAERAAHREAARLTAAQSVGTATGRH